MLGTNTTSYMLSRCSSASGRSEAPMLPLDLFSADMKSTGCWLTCEADRGHPTQWAKNACASNCCGSSSGPAEGLFQTLAVVAAEGCAAVLYLGVCVCVCVCVGVCVCVCVCVGRGTCCRFSGPNWPWRMGSALHLQNVLPESTSSFARLVCMNRKDEEPHHDDEDTLPLKLAGDGVKVAGADELLPSVLRSIGP